MSVPAMDEAFYTPKEVAAATGLHYQTVLDYIKDGSIPSAKFGRIYKVPARWVHEHRGDSQPLLHVVPEPVAPPLDYAPLASVLEILGQAMVQAAGALRGTS